MSSKSLWEGGEVELEIIFWNHPHHTFWQNTIGARFCRKVYNMLYVFIRHAIWIYMTCYINLYDMLSNLYDKLSNLYNIQNIYMTQNLENIFQSI